MPFEVAIGTNRVHDIIHKLTEENPFHEDENIPNIPRIPDVPCSRRAPVAAQLAAIQRAISSLQYNYLPRTFFSLQKNRAMQSIINTAKDIINESLPIRCLEASFLALYYTSHLDTVDRIPLAFKSYCNGRNFRHIVMVVRYNGAFGALGLSRCPVLMDKPLTFYSLAELVDEYRRSYESVNHRLVSIKVGLALEHNPLSRRVPCWRFMSLRLPSDGSPAQMNDHLHAILVRYTEMYHALSEEFNLMLAPPKNLGAGPGGKGGKPKSSPLLTTPTSATTSEESLASPVSYENDEDDGDSDCEENQERIQCLLRGESPFKPPSKAGLKARASRATSVGASTRNRQVSAARPPIPAAPPVSNMVVSPTTAKAEGEATAVATTALQLEVPLLEEERQGSTKRPPPSPLLGSSSSSLSPSASPLEPLGGTLGPTDHGQVTGHSLVAARLQLVKDDSFVLERQRQERQLKEELSRAEEERALFRVGLGAVAERSEEEEEEEEEEEQFDQAAYYMHSEGEEVTDDEAEAKKRKRLDRLEAETPDSDLLDLPRRPTEEKGERNRVEGDGRSHERKSTAKANPAFDEVDSVPVCCEPIPNPEPVDTVAAVGGSEDDKLQEQPHQHRQSRRQRQRQRRRQRQQQNEKDDNKTVPGGKGVEDKDEEEEGQQTTSYKERKKKKEPSSGGGTIGGAEVENGSEKPTTYWSSSSDAEDDIPLPAAEHSRSHTGRRSSTSGSGVHRQAPQGRSDQPSLSRQWGNAVVVSKGRETAPIEEEDTGGAPVESAGSSLNSSMIEGQDEVAKALLGAVPTVVRDDEDDLPPRGSHSDHRHHHQQQQQRSSVLSASTARKVRHRHHHHSREEETKRDVEKVTGGTTSGEVDDDELTMKKAALEGFLRGSSEASSRTSTTTTGTRTESDCRHAPFSSKRRKQTQLSQPSRRINVAPPPAPAPPVSSGLVVSLQHQQGKFQFIKPHHVARLEPMPSGAAPASHHQKPREDDDELLLAQTTNDSLMPKASSSSSVNNPQTTREPPNKMMGGYKPATHNRSQVRSCPPTRRTLAPLPIRPEPDGASSSSVAAGNHTHTSNGEGKEGNDPRSPSL